MVSLAHAMSYLGEKLAADPSPGAQAIAMNRVQFQTGLSMPAFFDLYGTEAQCEAAVIAARWPHGFVCPQCAGTSHCILRVRHRPTFQCLACRQQTSIIAGPSSTAPSWRCAHVPGAVSVGPGHAAATIERLVEAANKVQETRDRTTLLKVVNGSSQEKSRRNSRRKKNSLRGEAPKLLF
jgi:hypothetical protein